MTLQQTLEAHGYQTRIEATTGARRRDLLYARPNGRSAWVRGSDALYAIYREMGMPAQTGGLWFSDEGSAGEVAGDEDETITEERR